MGKVMAGMTVSLDGFMDADKVSPDFDELLQAPSFKEKPKTLVLLLWDGMCTTWRTIYVD